MTEEELLAMLNAHEWRDIEFKQAQRDVPRDAYETVSAFANTDGGHLVFGVKKDGTGFEIVGVLNVDKVQNDFLTSLRSTEKISAILDVTESLHPHEETNLLVFYVPEAHRSDKPVHLNNDIRKAFIRRGGCDFCCSEEERNRFLVDAATQRYDGHPLDFNLDTCFDHESIRWYRENYERRTGNRSCTQMSDQDFLAEMGLIVEQAGHRQPSRAAILLFGSNAAFRQILPRPVVDCQRFSLPLSNADTGERWADRIIVEENLIKAWQVLIEWYIKLAERPFKIDSSTLQREDTPPDYRAFREAMINIIIHQDYSDHSRKPEIRQYIDQTVFWNPGDAFATGIDLLEPGEKEVRNPCLVTAFRRIGLSEHAGWGLRDVFRNWQQLGYVPPGITNDKGRKTFELVLKKEELLSEQQLLFQASLGVHLSDKQARAFAYICRKQEISLSELKAVTELSGPEAIELADYLIVQNLLNPLEGNRKYALAEHLRERFWQETVNIPTAQVQEEQPNLSTAQVVQKQANLSTRKVPAPKELTKTQWKIIEFCDVPRRLVEIMEFLKLSNRGYFKTNHLDPLIDNGVIAMTNPEKPRASDQRYIITEVGTKFKERRLQGKSKGSEDSDGKAS